MVKEIKWESLGTDIIYFSNVLYKMSRTGKAVEFLPCERMFVCQLKLSWDNSPIIWENFMKRFGSPAGVL